jgi:hypothetical protein
VALRSVCISVQQLDRVGPQTNRRASARAVLWEGIAMRETIRSLIDQHDVFYEVVPHYVILDVADGSARRLEKVQPGFDVYVYGVNQDSRLTMPPPHTYARVYAELRRLAKEVWTQTAHSCLIDVMPFPSTIVVNARDFAKVAAVLHLRISHWGVGQPAGPAEARALEAITRELEALGIARR